MDHPFAEIFESALRRATSEENAVLEEAEVLRQKGNRPEEIYFVLETLHEELTRQQDIDLVGQALEEFAAYLD